VAVAGRVGDRKAGMRECAVRALAGVLGSGSGSAGSGSAGSGSGSAGSGSGSAGSGSGPAGSGSGSAGSGSAEVLFALEPSSAYGVEFTPHGVYLAQEDVYLPPWAAATGATATGATATATGGSGSAGSGSAGSGYGGSGREQLFSGLAVVAAVAGQGWRAREEVLYLAAAYVAPAWQWLSLTRSHSIPNNLLYIYIYIYIHLHPQ
jgi:hypothetical protein